MYIKQRIKSFQTRPLPDSTFDPKGLLSFILVVASAKTEQSLGDNTRLFNQNYFPGPLDICFCNFSRSWAAYAPQKNCSRLLILKLMISLLSMAFSVICFQFFVPTSRRDCSSPPESKRITRMKEKSFLQVFVKCSKSFSYLLQLDHQMEINGSDCFQGSKFSER